MVRRRFASLAASVLALLAAPSAQAFQQPDGTTIPTGSGLQGLFDGRGEAINAVADANVVPETFTPACALTFEVLQRNAGYKNSFGWYNVTGAKPAASDLHEFLSCNDGVGTKKVLDIKADPAYKGGQIAFYQATGDCGTVQNNLNIFYSEKAWNPDGANYFHLLIYNSTVVPKAFYFGWEDLLSGGDNDFDDLTTFVTGISCTGGGASCDTGQQGVCSVGTLQCQSGKLTCVGTTKPTTEKCDGVDNDCNGMTDDGTNLCPTDFVCDKGACVPKCGKDNCPSGTSCDPVKGVCIEDKCATVTCPNGKKCVGGACLAPCDGVVCPAGQACNAGACVDPCVGLTCDKDQVCAAGVCVDNCQCAGCPGGKTCQPSGQCVPTVCVGKTCQPGFTCDPGTGNCVDACTGVKCPGNGVCKLGVCEAPPVGGSGGSGGSAGASGASGAAGTAGKGGGAGGTAGASGTGGSGGASGAAGKAGASGGAGVAGASGGSGAAGAAGSAGKSGGAGAGGSSGGAGAGGSAGKSGAAGAGGGAGASGAAGTGAAGTSGAAGKGGSSAAGSGGKGGASGAGIAGGGSAPELDDSSSSGGCGCAVPQGRLSGGALALGLAAAGALLRRRRRR